VLLDGEVVVQTPEALQDFSALESAIGSEKPDDRLLFYVFDILHLDVFDLRGCTLLDRKRVLKALLEGVKDPIRYSEHFEADGPEFFRNACKLGFEGVVAKLVTSKYHSGRTADWVKTTCRHRDTFVVAGWAEKQGHFDGLYLGREDKGKLVYAGKLERGFTEQDKDRVLAMVGRLKAKKAPMVLPRRFPKAQWVQPRVLVDAEFRGKTPAGLLRHPAFKGVRRDLMESDR
jgi:bifunctional non-homologous end joining protein LigD